jgi:two-component system response regulator YesN
VFKTGTGDSFSTYLDKVRIEKAKELLSCGYKVYQVAEIVGYAYVDYFHTKFRKYAGMSPMSFRKNSREE